MTRKMVNWGLVALLGVFLLYGLYNKFVTTKILKSYQGTFQKMEHPRDTGLIDEFRSRFSYYPATYRDESIKNACVYLVGELRSHTGDWNEIQEFYAGNALLHNGTDEIIVGEFPIEVVPNNGASISFDMNNNYSYSPFDVDILAKLENDYYFWGFPDGLGNVAGSVYAVYIAPDCE